MSEGKWTAEQKAAIYTHGSHLLVSAAAGAGKTAVLVERIIRTVTDPVNPVDIDQLLVVTFTNAAAAEMRERIGRALSAELEKKPQENNLLRQLTRLSSASIMTLHAFCLDVLRQYYYCIDLDPAFKIANDAETALLRAQALENIIEDLYMQNDDGFLTLVDMYGGSHDDRKLAEIILKLYDYARSHPRPRQWLEQAAGLFAADSADRFEESLWVTEIKQFLHTQLHGCREKLQQAAHLVKNGGEFAGYRAALADDCHCIEEMLHLLERGWMYLEGNFAEKLSGALPRIKVPHDEEVKEKVQQIRSGVKKQLGKLKNDYFGRSARDWQKDLENLRPVMQTLILLVQTFAGEYAGLKTGRGLLDFGDLEHKCLEILHGDSDGKSPAARDIGRRYREILVDEYQDINEVQESILRLVSRRQHDCVSMFMVGDVKQSIYRFRLAEPSLFLQKYHNYDQSGPEGRRIDLARNFRSNPRVIDAVNFLFRQIMTPYVGEMIYDAKAQLICGLEGATDCCAPVEMHLREKPANIPGNNAGEETGEIGEADDAENLTGFSAEANIIARRIGEMISLKDTYQIFDKKTGATRAIEYRDIVILLRATKGKAELLLDVLRKYDIPAYAEVSTGYFAAMEVKILLSLLQIIDNPRQDIPLAAVLRSPVIGLTAEELATIRSHAPRSDYWDALCACAAGGTVLGEKVRGFTNRLDIWRTDARQRPLSVLIWQLLQETGIYDYVGSMPGGIQRQANLRALYHRACQYEDTKFRGLFRFLRFIEGLQKSGSDLATARTLGENENVVRIMSVHKSKGLEFPVVFLADIGKRFNKTDLYSPVLCHKALGLGPEIVDPPLSIHYPSLAKKAIQLRLQREALSEELRILYVALTRARERLILVGSVKNPLKRKDQWSSFLSADKTTLPDWFLAEANSWLDWIAPAVARHRDGAPLRHEAGCGAAPWQLHADKSQWSICLYNDESAGRIAVDQEKDAGFAKAMQQVSDKDVSPEYEVINTKLNWLYPFSAVKGYPAKMSVSALKENVQDAAEDFIPQPLIYNRPRFLQAQTALNQAERGSAVHLVMQHADLHGPLTEQAIRKQIDELARRRIITDIQAQAVDAGVIAAFFATQLGRRMCKAGEIWRELKFSMVLDGQRLYPEIENEKIFVQGVIDCLFAEGDDMVLLDYKTDYAGSHIAPELFQAYRRQIGLYVEAVEQLLQRPVKEAYIYFMATGETVGI